MLAIWSVLLLFSTVVYAQDNPMGQRMRQNPVAKISGKVIEGKSKDAIPFATVVLLNQKDSLITGGLTRNNGDFQLEKVPFGRFKIRVQYIGFKTLFVPVTVTPATLDQDIGNLAMQPDANQLQEQVVTAQKPTVIIGVDRRVYNVDKDLTAAGGTAVDVMKNIPGLTVDADGNVSLRNNSPTIFIDGRPTTLTMEQIPADQIDRVEVITNPSAKYDASASGGIVNVVMKKNDKPGYNGMIGANAGTNQFSGLDRYGVNGNLNIKEKRVNFSINYTLNYGTNPTKGYTNRTTLSHGEETGTLHQDNLNISNRWMQHIRLGLDYTLSNRNTITLAQRFMYGTFGGSDDQHFNQTDSTHTLISYGNRTTSSDGFMRNYGSQLMWKHTFPKQGKEFIADLNYNYRTNANLALFTTNNYNANGTLMANNPQWQNNDGTGNAKNLTFQADYTNPLTDTARLEFGVKSNYVITGTGLIVSKKFASAEYYVDTSLTSDYRIYDLTNAAYVNYTNMFKGIGYQAGVRFEQTRFIAELQNKNQQFEYLYPNGTKNLMKAFFPSLYLSKKITPAHEVQLNFSRKINRPGWMQVIPFIMFSDRNNIQIGNPALAPEFTNLMELNYNNIFKIGNWLTSFYGRYQQNPITPYVYQSVTDSSILVSSFINGTSNIAYGWENTLKLGLLNRKLDFSVNTNIFHTAITATAGSTALKNTGLSWNAKSMLSYKLPKQYTVQVNGSYEAPRIIAQGKTKEVYSMDFSVSKEVSKKLTFNFTINDVFNTRGFGSLYTTDLFTQDLWRRRETRFFRIGFSYRFGEWDVSIFKRRPNRSQEQQDQGDF